MGLFELNFWDFNKVVVLNNVKSFSRTDDII